MLVTIPLAQILKVKPEKVFDFMAVKIGDSIKKGEAIAVKKGFLSDKIEVKAELDGIIKSLSIQTGELVMEASVSDNKNIKEAIEPRYVEKKRSEGVLVQKPKDLKISKNKIIGVFGFGLGAGELAVCDKMLDFSRLKKEYKKKIVYAPSISGKGAFYKASAIGLSGLLILSVEKNILEDLQEIAQDSNFGFLLLSEKADLELAEKIKKWHGKNIRIDGLKKEVYLIS